MSGVVVSMNRNLTLTFWEFWRMKMSASTTATPSAQPLQLRCLACG